MNYSGRFSSVYCDKKDADKDAMQGRELVGGKGCINDRPDQPDFHLPGFHF